MASSLVEESRLADSGGRSVALDSGLLLAMDMGEDSAFVVSQQNVSLFHSRQLRFSNLRPCSTESAHLEKTR